MKYPYIRFATYLMLLGKNLEEYIYPLPIPDARDIFEAFPKAKKTAAFFKKEDLQPFKKSTDDAVIAFTIWNDSKIQNIVNIGIIGNQNDLLNFLNKKLPITITEEGLRLYKKVFFDIEGWTPEDWNEYLSKLKSINTIDYKIYNLLLNDANIEYVYKILGVNVIDLDIENILKEMLLSGFMLFNEAEGKDKLPFGKFVSSLAKQLDKSDEDTEDTLIYERIKAKMKKVSRDRHNSELPESLEQMQLEIGEKPNE